jgi:hypothetical protein
MTTRVGFSTPKIFNPLSWLVRKVTGSSASHAFFVYWDQDFDLDMVMEAHEFGFRLTPFALFEKKNHVVGLYRPNKSIDVGLKYVAQNYLGTVYDYGGLLGQIAVQLGRWFKRKWLNPFRGSKNVFCSEAVCIAMQHSPGYEDFKEDPDSVDPQTLMQYFEGGFGVKFTA